MEHSDEGVILITASERQLPLCASVLRLLLPRDEHNTLRHSEIRDVSILRDVEACPCTLVLDFHAVIGSTSSGVLNMPS
jgi:hypothetical protein